MGLSLTLAAASPTSVAKQGEIDLRSSRFDDRTTVRLDGEWRFLHGRFRAPYLSDSGRTYLNVPGLWRQPIGYGTYSLDILLPESDRAWALALPPVASAYQLYANGKPYLAVGGIDSTVHMKPDMRSRTIEIQVSGDHLRLDIQVANFHFASGGFPSAPLIGYPEGIHHSYLRSMLIPALLIGSLIIMSLYYGLLSITIRQQKETLFFSLACLCMALREFFTGNALFFTLFPDVPFTLSIKLLYSVFPAALISFMHYFRTLYAGFSKLLQRTVEIGGGLYLILVLGTPNTFHGGYLPVVFLLFVLLVGYLFYRSIKTPLAPYENRLMVVGLLLLVTACTNDVLNELDILRTWYALPTSFFLFVLCQALLLANRYKTALGKAGKLEVEVAKNRFLSNITHELKTPLTLVIGHSESMLNKEVMGLPLPNPIASIYHQSLKLLNLINQLLDLSKIEAKAMPIQFFRTNVALLTQSVIHSFEIHCKEKNLKLILSCRQLPEDLVLDPEKYERILTNLVSNAVKYTEAGGSIWVNVSASSEDILLTVKDTGIGIEPARQAHIFRRFYQASERNTVGSGIGLFLVKELLDLLGGKIHIESVPSQGTAFHVRLPIGNPHDVPLFIPADLPPPLPLASTGSAEKEFSVLVVEDHTELRAFISANLSPYYRVYQAENAEAGWETCQTELPDAVISDIMLPGIDGYQLCQLIKQNKASHHIAVILLTAKSRTEHRIKGLSFEANDYLTKPFHMGELLLRLQNLVNYQKRLRAYNHQKLTAIATTESTELTDPFLDGVYTIIDNELANSKFTVEDLSDQLAVSSRTLSRTLKKLTGLSTNEVIRNYRLKRSIEFLQSGHNISETAYLAGFDSPSYFGKCFREVFSESPSAYQKATN